jgi:hypothetical protein
VGGSATLQGTKVQKAALSIARVRYEYKAREVLRLEDERQG